MHSGCLENLTKLRNKCAFGLKFSDFTWVAHFNLIECKLFILKNGW